MIDAGRGNLPGVSRCQWCRNMRRACAAADVRATGREMGSGRDYSRAARLKNSPGVRPINWRKAAMKAEVES